MPLNPHGLFKNLDLIFELISIISSLCIFYSILFVFLMCKYFTFINLILFSFNVKAIFNWLSPLIGWPSPWIKFPCAVFFYFHIFIFFYYFMLVLYYNNNFCVMSFEIFLFFSIFLKVLSYSS
jgi:hypothetical protein